MQKFYFCGETQEIQHLIHITFNIKKKYIVRFYKTLNNMTPHLYLL